MAQQLSFLNGVHCAAPQALPNGIRTLSSRIVRRRPASPAQESLFEFQAVEYAVLIIPKKTVLPSSPPEHHPSSPTAVESADKIQPVRITFHGAKAKTRDILAATSDLEKSSPWCWETRKVT